MKKLVLFLACGLMIGNLVFAQTAPLKIGYINSAELLSAMPERTKADSDIAKYAKSFQDQIDLMMKDYQSKGQAYQKDEKTMTEAMKEVRMKEIQDLQNRIESINQSAQEKLQAKKQDMYQPIIDKVNKALKDVAKEKNFDFIFDQAAGGALLYGKESFDITQMIKQKLGIK